MSQNQQKIHSSNELAKATEIPPFLGVTDSGFVQRIAHNYIKPPRAFLFSHYILSKIQRRLASTSAMSIRDFAPYRKPKASVNEVNHKTKSLVSEANTFETPAANRQTPSRTVFAPEKASEIPLSTSPLQPLFCALGSSMPLLIEVPRNGIPRIGTLTSTTHKHLLLRTPVKNALGQFGLQTVREGGSLAEERAQISNFKLLFSEEPSHILSVKPVVHEVTGGPEKSGLLSQRRTEPSEVLHLPASHTSRQAGEVSAGRSEREGIISQSFLQKKSESSQREEFSTPPSQFEGIGIFRKSVSSIPVNINDVSFAGKVVEKSKSESSIVGSDNPSQIGQLKLATFREVAHTDSELTHAQRKKGHENLMEQPDASSGENRTGVQLEGRGVFRIPTTQGTHSVLAGATPILANGKMEPVVQSLSGLKPTIGMRNSDFPISFRIPHSAFHIPVSRQDKILTTQDKSAEGVNRQTAEQTRESTNNVIARAARQSESPPLTTDSINVLQRSVSSSTVAISEALARPAIMVGRCAAEEISFGMQPTHVDNAMRIFRRYLDMPHVRFHNDAAANFMAAKLNAEAFTMGRDVFFASGRLNLSTPKGIALLGHELTHVKQQEQQSATSDIGEVGALQRDALENEALANEQTILSFLSTQPQTFTSSQRDTSIITRKLEYTGDEPVELTHIPKAFGVGERSEPKAFGVGERSEHSPQIQYAMPQRNSTPLMAEEGRAMETATSAETPTPPPPEPTTPSMDINRIAEEVYEIIERRLRSEKERRGYF